MDETPHEYGLRGEQPWDYPDNPGERPAIPTHRTVPRSERDQLCDAWSPKKERWETLINVHRAAFEAMKLAVPKAYRSQPDGTPGWTINMTIHQMLESLDPYCLPTMSMISQNEKNLTASYNHTTPIATLFERFEDCHDIAMAEVPYTTAQLIQKFMALMEATKVYDDEIEEWKAKPTADKTWGGLKRFWLKAYLKKRGRPSSTLGGAGYGNNPFAGLAEEQDPEVEAVDDDVSVITEQFSALLTEQRTSRDTIAQLEQRLAAAESHLTPNTAFGAQNAPPTQHVPPYVPTSRPAYQQPYRPPRNPPAYQQPPPPYQAPYQPYQTNSQYPPTQGGGRGNTYGRGRNSRGRGRGRHNGRGNYYANPQGNQYAGQPPQGYQYAGQPSSGTHTNPNKYQDNDWFCWSCGFNVDHTSGNCPYKRWPNHQVGATQYNLRQFMNCGRWCMKVNHKKYTASGQSLQWEAVQPPQQQPYM